MGGCLHGDVVVGRNEKERTPMLDASVSFLEASPPTPLRKERGRSLSQKGEGRRDAIGEVGRDGGVRLGQVAAAELASAMRATRDWRSSSEIGGSVSSSSAKRDGNRSSTVLPWGSRMA